MTEPHYLALRFLAKDSTNKDLETPSEKEVKEEVNKAQELIGDTTRLQSYCIHALLRVAGLAGAAL